MGRPALERDGGALGFSGSSDAPRPVTGNAHKRSLIDRIDGGEMLGRIKEGGLLHSFIQKTDTSLEITRQNSKQARGRGLVDLDLTLSGDGPQELPHCEGVTFHFGAITTPKGRKKPTLNLRLLHRPSTGDTFATMQGDLSLLLPSVGLIPVGNVPRFTLGVSAELVGHGPRRLVPDEAGLFGAHSQFHVPLGKSLLVVDDVRNHIRITPAVDMRGRIYRIGNTGVLVGFESLRFSCDGTKPRLGLSGGRIWQRAGA